MDGFHQKEKHVKIDLDRFQRGAKQLRCVGRVAKLPHRLRVIEDAILAIQTNQVTALSEEYMGVKNYAAFGDQRCDCSYGMGPSHGSIVFMVGRASGYKGPMDSDAVYALEVFRDTGDAEFMDNPFIWGDRDSEWKKRIGNVFEAVDFLMKAQVAASSMLEALNNLSISPSD